MPVAMIVRNTHGKRTFALRVKTPSNKWVQIKGWWGTAEEARRYAKSIGYTKFKNRKGD